MQINKGTKCILSDKGYYGIFYMSKNVSQFNRDCVVEPKPYINGTDRNFVAVQTEVKNIGFFEAASESTIPIIVWVQSQ